MARIGQSRALEELARLEGLPSPHHAQAQLIQDSRTVGCELRRTDKEFVGLAAVSCGARGLCRLDHPEHVGVLRGYRFDVAQRFLASRIARRGVYAGSLSRPGRAGP